MGGRMSLVHRIQLPLKYEKYGWNQIERMVPYEQSYIDDLKEWCRVRIGDNKWNYYGMYRKVPYEFRFKRSEDLLAFKLTHGL
jgi:hypothetical protein